MGRQRSSTTLVSVANDDTRVLWFSHVMVDSTLSKIERVDCSERSWKNNDKGLRRKRRYEVEYPNRRHTQDPRLAARDRPRHQLLQLARCVKDHQDSLAAVIHADLSKPLLEAVMGEAIPIYERALICASKIEEWAKETNITDQAQDWQKSWNPRIVRQARASC